MKSTTTIRISKSSRQTLRQISQRENKSMQAVLEQIIESHRRCTFLEGLAEDFAALRESDAEWQAEKQERAEWDHALAEPRCI